MSTFEHGLALNTIQPPRALRLCHRENVSPTNAHKKNIVLTYPAAACPVPLIQYDLLCFGASRPSPIGVLMSSARGLAGAQEP